MAFSPDGHTLATASRDDTARLWETDVDRVAAQICSITPAITESEWDHYLPGLAYRPPCPRELPDRQAADDADLVASDPSTKYSGARTKR